MGASFVRTESPPSQVSIAQGDSLSLAIPHIYNEFTPEVDYNINMRQAAEIAQLPFVSIAEAIGESIILFDTKAAQPGDYELNLDSFDLDSSSGVTLYTDLISVRITEPLTTNISLPALYTSAVE